MKELITRLAAETAIMSSVHAMRATVSYGLIRKQGDAAIEDLLAALDQGTAVIAVMALLHDITGASPVTREDRGKVSKMIEAWRAWGSERKKG